MAALGDSRIARRRRGTAIRCSVLFAISYDGRHPLFDGGNMQAGDRNARVVIKPYNHSTPLGIQSGVISTGHRISPPTARNDGECLEWARLQMLTNISDHTLRCCSNPKLSATRNFWRTIRMSRDEERAAGIRLKPQYHRAPRHWLDPLVRRFRFRGRENPMEESW